VFSSFWLLTAVSVWGCAVALAVASSAALGETAVAGTSACLGSSLTWASSAFKDGELSVEALVALSVAAGADFSSNGVAGVVAFGTGCSEPLLTTPSACFSSAGVFSPLLSPPGRAFSIGAISVIAVLPSARPLARTSSFFSPPSISVVGASPFLSPLSFFLVMCPRKLA
uniref:Secreted protein n=1 Tax=Pseudonaja textilis TaxID=8673 RepID=A0A670YQL6_PSETE